MKFDTYAMLGANSCFLYLLLYVFDRGSHSLAQFSVKFTAPFSKVVNLREVYKQTS